MADNNRLWCGPNAVVVADNEDCAREYYEHACGEHDAHTDAEWLESWPATPGSYWVHHASDNAAEIERLRAKLAELEAALAASARDKAHLRDVRTCEREKAQKRVAELEGRNATVASRLIAALITAGLPGDEIYDQALAETATEPAAAAVRKEPKKRNPHRVRVYVGYTRMCQAMRAEEARYGGVMYRPICRVMRPDGSVTQYMTDRAAPEHLPAINSPDIWVDPMAPGEIHALARSRVRK